MDETVRDLMRTPQNQAGLRAFALAMNAEFLDLNLPEGVSSNGPVAVAANGTVKVRRNGEMIHTHDSAESVY